MNCVRNSVDDVTFEMNLLVPAARARSVAGNIVVIERGQVAGKTEMGSAEGRPMFEVQGEGVEPYEASFEAGPMGCWTALRISRVTLRSPDCVQICRHVPIGSVLLRITYFRPRRVSGDVSREGF